MLIDEFLCKREVLGKRTPHSFTPPSKCGRCVQQVPQQNPTQKGSPRLVVKAPKMSLYNKRSSSEALGANSKKDILNKRKIKPSSQVVDLEEEEPKRKMRMEMVEGASKKEDVCYH
jgi:hypothetical protein